jgi:hypothetical protein
VLTGDGAIGAPDHVTARSVVTSSWSSAANASAKVRQNPGTGMVRVSAEISLADARAEQIGKGHGLAAAVLIQPLEG